MELKKHHVEEFIKAYKQSFGEELSYKEAHDIAHRLVHIFLILERAQIEQMQQEDLSD